MCYFKKLFRCVCLFHLFGLKYDYVKKIILNSIIMYGIHNFEAIFELYRFYNLKFKNC